MAGNAFQRTGAPTLKDLSAKVLHFVSGLTSKFTSLSDLSPPLVGGCKWIRFCKYLGPILLTHLWVRVRILYCILCFIGSQCSSFRHSVMLSLFLFLMLSEHTCFGSSAICSRLCPVIHTTQSYSNLDVIYIGLSISEPWS